jgi:integrase
LRRLRATFNFAKKRGWLQTNPCDGIDFLPEEKKLKFVPTSEQVEAVIAEAEPDTQDYLWTIRDTLGRMSEINGLKWADVDLEHRYVVLYTRKKRGGHLTPRKVPMTERLYEIMLRRYRKRDPSKPWVFWHTYWSSKTGEKCEGPYKARKRIMRTLCNRAGVPYFRFHALRHSGASILDDHNVPMGAIQRILGHESRITTEIYLHSIRETEREAVRVLDGNVIPFSPKKSHTDSHTATMEREVESA